MDIGAGRTRVTDLAFQVHDRSIHPDWYQVRAFRRIETLSWQVDLRILDAGHAIHWQRGFVQVCEVLTGSDCTLPDAHLRYRSELRQEKATQLDPTPEISYQSCFSVERLDPAVFRHVSEELSVDRHQIALDHRSVTRNRLNPSALSLMRIDGTLKRLSVWCFHTFPDECAVVRTQSLFEVNV